MQTAPKATTQPKASLALAARLSDYALLGKLRLASLVVLSAGIGYLIGVPQGQFEWLGLMGVISGGLLVTMAANTLNQLIERREDALMQRTADRPVAAGRMSVAHGAGFAVAMGAAGLAILGSAFGLMPAMLAASAILSYAFVYTPSKRWGPVAVLIGAFPGALPPLIGYVAASGRFDGTAGLLFALQTVWQLPHFWAVAWRLDADYRRAGYRLLPFGKGRAVGLCILLSTLAMLPVLGWGYAVGLLSMGALVALVAVVLLFAYPGWALLQTQSDEAALRVMFASFIALPAMQLILLIDHLL